MNLALDEKKTTQGIMIEFADHGEEYEAEIGKFMRMFLQEGDTFIDCGAHVGFFTVLGAELGTKVYAFEPEKTNFKSLKQNIHINGYENTYLFNKAVGDENREIDLYVCLDNDGGNAFWDISKHPFNKKTKLNKKMQKTEMVTLDSVINDPVKLIKIDVEGCEFKVLKGAYNLLLKYHPAVILEINDTALEEMGSSRIEVIRFMNDLNYNCYDLLTGNLRECNTEVNTAFVFNVVFIPKELNG